MRFEYSAYLLAEFRFVGTNRSPVLYQFCVRSEKHDQITTDWKRGFYATVTHAQSNESYTAAVALLRKTTQTMLPSVAELVRW